MRLTTMLVITTAAFAAFAPAAGAAVTSPPDWGQPGPDPSTTSNHAYGGGCITTATAPTKARGQNRSTSASGGLYCPSGMQSMSVLACTDIYAPNDVWSVGGLTDGSSWRPLSCTAAPDATNAVRLNARDVNTGAGCPTTFLFWPGNPTVRTELVTQYTSRFGRTFTTLAYSQPRTFSYANACPGGGYGGPV